MKALALALALVASVAQAGEKLQSARVTAYRVVDGDTIEATLDALPGRLLNIRIRDMDAPESWRPRCAAEKRAGLAAKAALGRLLLQGEVTVSRVDVGADKYGRTLADIQVDGGSVSRAMIAAGHARPYRAGRRQPWC
jgi:endonuclease YncB( thermonuclease family)